MSIARQSARTRGWVLGAVVWAVACAPASSAPTAQEDAAVGRDASGALDAATVVADAGAADDAAADAGPPSDDAADAAPPNEDAATPPDDATTAPHAGWAHYTIAPGSHAATVAQNGAPRAPLSGVVSAGARTYDFIFDLSAIYILTNPTQPDDQLDWNKLPGLSDCGQLDLAQDGLMFAWRWRPDLTPQVLEIAHYANNGGNHLYPAAGLITLDEDDLRAEVPLHYALTITSTSYDFHLSGTVGARAIDERATFPRRCTSSMTALKWAGGFYFGGTSTAPHRVHGWVLE